MRCLILCLAVAYVAAQDPSECPRNACINTCASYVKDDKNCDTCRCACRQPTCNTTCETFALGTDGCPTCDCARKQCPVVTTKCEWGNEIDADGCKTDKCKPPPTACPAVFCALYCENGFEINEATGCPSCRCKPPVCTPCNTLVACPNGYKYDDKGCQTCECADPPVCTGLLTCRLYCEFGYEVDAKGCPICSCAKPQCPTCNTFVACQWGFVKDPKTGCDTCQCAPDPTCPALICTAQFCEFGYLRDPTTKCPTCQCAPNPNPCPQVLCLIACPYGNIKDENGCETCRCVPPPSNCSAVGINDAALARPCAIRCQYGLEVDATTKCPICSCLPPPPCPQIRCARFCPNGFKYDKQGCQTCECVERIDVCTLPAVTGNCKAAIEAYAFDGRTRKCVKFTWGGCDDGNTNRFMDIALCEKTCLPPFTIVIKLAATATLTAEQADAITRAIASATGAERVALDSSTTGQVTIMVYDATLTTEQVKAAVNADIARNDQSAIKTAAGGQAVTGATVTGEVVTASPASTAAPLAGVVVALFVALRLM